MRKSELPDGKFQMDCGRFPATLLHDYEAFCKNVFPLIFPRGRRERYFQYSHWRISVILSASRQYQNRVDGISALPSDSAFSEFPAFFLAFLK